MRSYPKNDLYDLYVKYSGNSLFSARLPDHTNRRTLEVMNAAINCCDDWNSFIDIGAGDGRYTIPLLHKFKIGYAIEVEMSSGLERTSKEYKNLRYTRQLIQKAKIKDKIDFVLMVDVFEHIPLADMPNFIKKLNDLQSMGGVVYILTPNALHCGPATKSGLFHKILPFGHHKQYLAKEVEQLFAPYGYVSIFNSFEDTYFRLIVKHLIMVISMYDAQRSTSKVYYYCTYPLALMLNAVFMVLGSLACICDRRNWQNVFGTRSMVIVLKKINLYEK